MLIVQTAACSINSPIANSYTCTLTWARSRLNDDSAADAAALTGGDNEIQAYWQQQVTTARRSPQVSKVNYQHLCSMLTIVNTTWNKRPNQFTLIWIQIFVSWRWRMHLVRQLFRYVCIKDSGINVGAGHVLVLVLWQAAYSITCIVQLYLVDPFLMVAVVEEMGQQSNIFVGTVSTWSSFH